MTARRLRAYRPKPTPPARLPHPPPLALAPGHYDGDGCTFPAAGHLVAEAGQR